MFFFNTLSQTDAREPLIGWWYFNFGGEMSRWHALGGLLCLVLACGGGGADGGAMLQRMSSALIVDDPVCPACPNDQYCNENDETCHSWQGTLGSCTELGESCYYEAQGLCVDHDVPGPLCHPKCVVSVGNVNCGAPKDLGNNN
jgi:hypothetical protein